jgi:hypothetical protein
MSQISITQWGVSGNGNAQLSVGIQGAVGFNFAIQQVVAYLISSQWQAALLQGSVGSAHAIRVEVTAPNSISNLLSLPQPPRKCYQ